MPPPPNEQHSASGQSSDSDSDVSSEDDIPLTQLIRPKLKPKPQAKPSRPVKRKRAVINDSSSGSSASESDDDSDNVPLVNLPFKRAKPKPKAKPKPTALPTSTKPKPKPGAATAVAGKRRMVFTTSPDSKRTRMVITRKKAPKKEKREVLPMSDFISDSPWGSEEEEEDDEEDDDEDADMREEFDDDSDAPLRKRKKGEKRASTKGKKKKGISGRLTRTKPAQSSKQDVPIYDPDSYEVNEVLEPLKTDQLSVKWWDREPYKGEQKWSTLRHNGVIFPPAYEPHGVKLRYNGKSVKLTKAQEEVATSFAVLIESKHAKDPVFRANFWSDWKEDLGPDHVIQNLDKVDFKPIYDWYQEEKEHKKELRKNPKVKKELSEKKEREREIFGFVVVDGVREQVGNYMVELPGLFRGRGAHPKTGKVKRRLSPEDVVLNIGEGEKIPKCPVEGHKWGGIMHSNTVTYIARWKDPIQNTLKPVYLHPSSRFKGENDRKKYDVARELKKHIKRIRDSYTKNLTHSEIPIRQRATALWIIDVLSIRVGNEKDTNETADTVGVCTLRVEHVKLLKNNKVNFDFLGKDSMRYCNTVEMSPQIYANLKLFTAKKKPTALIFHFLTTSGINERLSDLMDGLTAKCFRTHNASVCLQEELAKGSPEKGGSITKNDDVDVKKHFYDRANRQVAILCNHQRTVSKNHDEQMKKAAEKLKNAKDRLEILEDELAEALGKPKKKKRKLNKDKDKKSPAKKKKARSSEVVSGLIVKQKARIAKMKRDAAMKADNKAIALGTSKINYMDPRITVAWCKNLEFPIEKVYQRTLLDKFPWAMAAQPDFVF